MRRLCVRGAGLFLLALSAVFADAGVAPVGALAQSRAPESAAEITLSFAPVVKKAAPAVVNIYAEKHIAERVSPFAGDPFFERFFRGKLGPGMTRERVARSLGSGVIVAADGIVVTNQHVIGDADQITVALSDRREFSASVMLSDKESDLAVLRLADGADLPHLEFGDSDALEVGDLVLAIGNPFGVGQTVTSGIISAQARGGAGGRTFIQTDAAINPGNSGGALVDMAGRLVGVNSAILTKSGGSNGIGFAIPGSLVSQAVRQAQAGSHSLGRPYLGVQMQTVDAGIARSLGLDRPQGVILTRVAPQSPFAQIGLGPGSVVLAVDRDPVNDAAELNFRLLALGLGASAEVQALKDGLFVTRTMPLAAPPETPERDISEISGGALSGLYVANLNPAVAEELIEELGKGYVGHAYKALAEGGGVVVLSARGRSARTDLRLGDLIRSINGRVVRTVDDFEARLRREDDISMITIERLGRPIILRRR